MSSDTMQYLQTYSLRDAEKVVWIICFVVCKLHFVDNSQLLHFSLDRNGLQYFL